MQCNATLVKQWRSQHGWEGMQGDNARDWGEGSGPWSLMWERNMHFQFSQILIPVLAMGSGPASLGSSTNY